MAFDRPTVSSRLLVASTIAALIVGLWPGVPAPTRAATSVFINEIHYDNTGTDAGEAIEIAGPAGTDLTGWSLVLYNGATNTQYDSDPLSGLIPDQGNGFGTAVVTYPVNGIQNGSPDAIALVNGLNVLVQFLSYEGTVSATSGPASGDTSVDIGVSEDGTEAIGTSLQLTGNGTSYEEFTWSTGHASTFGLPNAGQTFGTVTNQPVSIACGSPMSVLSGVAATRAITATDPDGTVTSISRGTITPTDPGTITLESVSPATEVGGTASATLMVSAATPAGTYQVPLGALNDDASPQTSGCSLTVTVTEVKTVGEVQGQTLESENGLTDASPYAGQSVWVRGVVTQRIRYNVAPTSSNPTGVQYAFFLQSSVADSDGDPLSSDGLLIYQNRFTTLLNEGSGSYFPVVGDQVVLHGAVSEFFNLTEMNNPRVAAVERTGVDLATEIETTEAAPPDDLADANRFWERHEGMRFHVDAGAHVVAARDVFPSTADGELWVIRGDHPIANRADPFARLVYRDTHPLDDIGPAGSFDNGNGMRIMLQSHGLKWAANDRALLIAPANTHDTVTNELTGALYFAFSKYGIEVEQQLQLEGGVDPALNAPPQAPDPDAEFATSDYNVENLYDFRDDPNDGCDFAGNAGCPGVSPPFDYVPASAEAYQKHLTDLAAQIAGPMHSPDLLMIQEAEDQDICWVSSGALTCGTADDADGKPDTLQELALAISDAGGPTYEAVFDRDGADDRGIVSAFLYRTDTVELLAPDAGDPVLGSAPNIEYRGAPLAYNADVQNPKAVNADLPADVDLSTGVDGSNVYTRPPQVGHFRVWRDGIGLSVFTDLYAISNHFSSTPDGRVGQRTEQAAYNAAIAEAILAADPNARIVSAGDFNVFPRPDDPFTPSSSRYPSDQLGPMYEAGLHNLWDTLVTEVPQSAYSYSFVGMAQTLDMQWADDNQFSDLVQVRAAHINADFAADYDGDTARGASDHDPQVARWFTDVTFDRLHALVDEYVAAGELPADKAFLFHDRLDKAEAYSDQGKTRTAQAQLAAFGNQAYDYASATIAGALQKEADRLATLL